MSAIRPISKSDIHRICSGQVVVDLCAGVKELVENALDAKATRVEVRLQHFGYDWFEVVDDGVGIPKVDRESVCLKHWTSKIKAFEDLQTVSSFGFRGEALSSLCESASSLTIITRCAGEEAAEKLVYDRAGKLVSASVAARAIGTTVTVTNLFDHLPVRRKDFEKNHRKHYANLLNLMQAYAVISTGVRVSVTNHQRDGKKTVAIATQGADKMGPNLASVFGHKFIEELLPIQFDFSIPLKFSGRSGTVCNETGNETEGKEAENESQKSTGDVSSCSSSQNIGRPDLVVSVAGYISKPGSTGIGRAGADRQFFFVNGRPAELKRFVKALNDVWRQFEMNHKPACALDVRLPPGSFDVNVTPDKREILIEREADIIERFKESLHATWEPSRFTFDRSQLSVSSSSIAQMPAEMSRNATAIPTATRASETVSENAGRNGEEVSSNLTGKFGAMVYSPSRRQEIAGNGDEVAQSEMAEPSQEEPSDVKRSPDRPQVIQEEAVVPDKPDGYVEGTPQLSKTAIEVVEFATQSDGSQLGTVSSLKQHDLTDADTSLPQNKRLRLASDAELAVIRPARPQRRQSLLDRFALGNAPKSSDGLKDMEDEEEEIVSTDDIEGETVESHQPTRAKQNQSKAEVQEVAMGSGSQERPNSRRGSPDSSLMVPTIRNVSDWNIGEAQTLLEEEKEWNNRCSMRLGATKDADGKEVAESLRDADLDVQDDAKAVARLRSVLSKSDFLAAEIVGQFNLGFVIARIGDELFIVDQHASDEKFRFETLQSSTRIEEQPLIAALPVELTPTEMQLIRDYLHVFEANGFHFAEDDSVDQAGEQEFQPTHQLMLVRVPHSKQTLFGAEDVRELAAILREDPPLPGVIPRLPKLRAMFASRACRSAIMIGDSLPPTLMAKLVANLSKLDQPWNCPHGRPTLRHLLHLPELNQLDAPSS